MLAVSERIIACEQGTKEWFDARMGCVGASKIADVTHQYKCSCKTKIAEHAPSCKINTISETRKSVLYEIACERLTGKTAEHYVSDYMQQGTEREPVARVEYEMLRGVTVEQVGFIYHPTIKWAGASPDGLVGDDGLLEIKCPALTTHCRYLAEDKIPDEYLPQMLWQLACEDTRLWSDFVSYCPEMPEPYKLFVKRLDRTKEAQEVIAAMEVQVEQFLREVETLLATLKERVKA